MSGDSSTEPLPQRRSWTRWIRRVGLALLVLAHAIYAMILYRAQTGIRIVEAAG